MHIKPRIMTPRTSSTATLRRRISAFTFSFCALSFTTYAQDNILTGTNTGADRIRIAVADFSALSTDGFKQTFDTVLQNDLVNAGIFDIVSKSLLPQQSPATPQQMQLQQWSSAPVNAAMVAFGSYGVQGGHGVVNGWLFDAKNSQYPQVLAKQYTDEPTENGARQMAHKFADEIILRLGGGIPGIAETKIYYIKQTGSSKEVWAMDYDGANQHAVTHLGTISLSPRISPDGSRLAFSANNKTGWDITMYSFDLNRIVGFPHFGGMNFSPSWSPDGAKLALSSTSRNGYPNILVIDASGGNPRRLTSGQGPDISPTWNRKTGAQIAFVSGRTGLPQIYTMEGDGTNVQRLTDQGYAVSPNWSPNGQFLTFSWRRNYGPGEPGLYDLYLMDIASKQWVQLTHDAGFNDFPCWSPDGRHIVFQSHRTGTDQIFSMLADGTNVKQLTFSGDNSQPDWSWK